MCDMLIPSFSDFDGFNLKYERFQYVENIFEAYGRPVWEWL